jgi:hypothetical protein
MHERSRNRKLDLAQLAKHIVDEATGERKPDGESSANGKNPHAAALGRLGGLKGGRARADSLTAEQRRAIARRAAEARWGHSKQT